MALETNSNLPTTMRATQIKDYGDIDDMISVQEGVSVPTLAAPPKTGGVFGPYGPFMLVKVLSVALSPGDWRTLSGKTRNLQGPSSFPYVPGGDLCGIVVQLPKDDTSEKLDYSFTIGDRIAARFTGNGPKGALGEYALVDMSMAVKLPNQDSNISSDEAAALASSAAYAVALADYVHEGNERVLIFGAGGGIGSHVCQLIRNRGASYIVGVSSAPERLLQSPLSYDQAIDYTKEDVFANEAFQKDPFDVIIDLSCGGWPRLEQDVQEGRPLIVKPASQGGRYITSMTDKPVFEVNSMAHFLWKSIHPALWRAFYSRTWTRSSLPTYSLFLGADDRSVLTRTMKLAEEGNLKAVLDERGPFPFTTTGVRDAFRVQQSRHVHGKVVIHVADQE